MEFPRDSVLLKTLASFAHITNAEDLIPREDAAIPINDAILERTPSTARITRSNSSFTRLSDATQNMERAIRIQNMERAIRAKLSVYGPLGYFDALPPEVAEQIFLKMDWINIFLDGFIPTENLRFREEALTFKVSETATEEEIKRMRHFEYPTMKKTLGEFALQVEGGEFTDAEIIVLLGENGTGKTTLIRLLAGNLRPDEGSAEVPPLHISYKPQKITAKYEGKVRSLLVEKIRDAFTHAQFNTDVMKPMKIEDIMDQDVQFLSGGELQRVALVLALGKPADVYLIDEPSAYLDSEQRLVAAKVIKKFILHAKKTAFVVEHDFIMATYLADRVIVFDGVPSQNTSATAPQSLLSGMNRFLQLLEISFRRDPNNFRPRINKRNSVKDTEQKRSGNYFFLGD